MLWPLIRTVSMTVLMMGHKICFYGEILLIIPKLSLLPLLMWSTAWCIVNHSWFQNFHVLDHTAQQKLSNQQNAIFNRKKIKRENSKLGLYTTDYVIPVTTIISL